MAQSSINAAAGIVDSSDNYYQISDDDMEDCDELGDECLLEEVEEGPAILNGSGGRGPYERAWTTDATRALIHIRGPMEDRFTEGRQKRTALWLHCTRQLQKLGYRYSSGKVQKKWHNILITYNKNLSKKYMSGYVHWEFFEDMFKYLQGKKADCDIHLQQHQVNNTQTDDTQMLKLKQHGTRRVSDETNSQYLSPNHVMMEPKVLMDSKSNDEFDEDSESVTELKQPKEEYNESHDLPLEITHRSANYEQHDSTTNDFPHIPHANPDQHTDWWKDYFERKLDVEREKVKLQREMYREQMQFNKMSLVQQEKIERIKIDAINSLTCTLQKLVEVKSRKA